mmetsp:Transcript_870/g.2186  ORF Transcript_870/g.2186 Transcript_870/m.2186 type:complete len:444 (-) Transcript_870:185-1516(-)
MARFVCFGEALLRFTPAKSSEDADGEVEAWEESLVGAELNVASALTCLGWLSPEFVSVLPATEFGDKAEKLLQQALATTGTAGTQQLRRSGEQLGTVRIWPEEKKRRVYQRDDSAFANLDPAWFQEDFWVESLSRTSQASSSLTFLHLSGVPPLLATGPAQSWTSALAGAHRAREGGARLVVTLELTPRREFGGYLELWMMTAPHLVNLDVLVLSVNILSPILTLLGASGSAWLARLDALRPAIRGLDAIALNQLPEGMASIEALDEILAGTLREMRRMLLGEEAQHPALLVTVKLLEGKRTSPGGAPRQRRWSLVSVGDRVISTVSTAVRHEPRTTDGGTDAWLAGIMDSLVSSSRGSSDPEPPQSDVGFTPFRLSLGPEDWATALRRGDQLAALKQDRSAFSSDHCTVTRTELEAALKVASQASPAPEPALPAAEAAAAKE